MKNTPWSQSDTKVTISISLHPCLLGSQTVKLVTWQLDLEANEYEELKKDAVAQLSEFEASLAKMSSGMIKV